MGQNRSVAALAFGNVDKNFAMRSRNTPQAQDLLPVESRSCNFPIAVRQVDVKQRLADPQMPVELTGKNSVNPSTIPSSTDNK